MKYHGRMKDDEGLFYFFFFCIVRVPYSRAVSPLFCDLIDCIIPRVRYGIYASFLSVSWRPQIHEQGSARCGGTSLSLVWWVVCGTVDT